MIVLSRSINNWNFKRNVFENTINVSCVIQWAFVVWTYENHFFFVFRFKSVYNFNENFNRWFLVFMRVNHVKVCFEACHVWNSFVFIQCRCHIDEIINYSIKEFVWYFELLRWFEDDFMCFEKSTLLIFIDRKHFVFINKFHFFNSLL